MNTTMKPGSVVVGVDGSPHSDAAVDWAAGYAAVRNRPLVLVNGAGEVGPGSQLVGTDEVRRQLRIESRRVTDHALERVQALAPSLEVSVSRPLVDAREALLGLADRASMIVVGTRGRGPVRSLVLGSVSVAVATHAECPVTVVRPTDRTETAGEGHVVVGIDDIGSSNDALDFAYDIASATDRSLDIVHAWSSRDTFVDPASYQQRLDLLDRHERIISEASAGYAEKFPDVVVTHRMPDGAAVHTLVEMSAHASLVVVGSRRRSGAGALMGSVSRAVVERAHCTVTVVRPPA